MHIDIMLNSSWIKLIFSFLSIFFLNSMSLFLLESHNPDNVQGFASEHQDLLDCALVHCQSEFLTLVVALCNFFSTGFQSQYVSSFSDQWFVVWVDLNVEEYIELECPFKRLDLKPNILLLIVWVTFNVGENLCGSFLDNHVSTEVINNVNVFNIFQKSSADLNQIQNETQWEFFRQIVDFDQNSLIFYCVFQGILKLGNGLFHFVLEEELGLERIESLGLEKWELFAFLDVIDGGGKVFMRNLDIAVPVSVVDSFIERVSWILQWELSLEPVVGVQELLSFGFDFCLDFLDKGVFGVGVLLFFCLVMDSFVQVGSHLEKNPNHRRKSLSELLFLLQLINVFFWFLFVVDFWWSDRLSLLLVVFGFVPDDALFLFNEHLLKLINDIVVINVAFVFFLISGLIVDEDTVGVVESAFFVSPSSMLIILEKEIVALEFESDWGSVDIELFDEVFPSGVWLSAGFHEIVSSVW